MNQRTCRVFDCLEVIPEDHTVCIAHYPEWKERLLGNCPNCGWFKSAEYALCLDCHNGSKPRKGLVGASAVKVAESRPKYESRKDVGEDRKDDAADKGYFVYVLKLDNGDFYAGRTNDLRSRYSEHRDGRTLGTAGRNPRLVWFTVVEDESRADDMEKQLQGTIKRNPRQVRRMAISFLDLVKSVDVDAFS